jgi:DNA repair exonuclease SbcCD ATPase subunit
LKRVESSLAEVNGRLALAEQSCTERASHLRALSTEKAKIEEQLASKIEALDRTLVRLEELKSTLAEDLENQREIEDRLERLSNEKNELDKALAERSAQMSLEDRI